MAIISASNEFMPAVSRIWFWITSEGEKGVASMVDGGGAILNIAQELCLVQVSQLLVIEESVRFALACFASICNEAPDCELPRP